MAKKTKKGLVGQIFMALIPVASIIFLVAVILLSVDTWQYFEDAAWMTMSSTLVIASAGLWYGWKHATLPGIGGKVAYLMCAAIIVLGIIFPPFYLYA